MTSIRLICARLLNRNFSTTRTDKLVEKYYPRLLRRNYTFNSFPSGILLICAILINIGGSYLRFIFGVRLGFSWHTDHVERFIRTISPLAIQQVKFHREIRCRAGGVQQEFCGQNFVHLSYNVRKMMKYVIDQTNY